MSGDQIYSFVQKQSLLNIYMINTLILDFQIYFTQKHSNHRSFYFEVLTYYPNFSRTWDSFSSKLPASRLPGTGPLLVPSVLVHTEQEVTYRAEPEPEPGQEPGPEPPAAAAETSQSFWTSL